MHRVSQQSYTEEALEAWLLHLKTPWESQFCKNALKLGREFYKYGVIRSLELDVSWAKATMKQDKIEDYVVVEVSKARWCFRGSYKAQPHNEALAVAALYEIEELLSEALPHLPLKTTPKRSAGASGSQEAPTEEPALGPLWLDVSLETQACYLYPFWDPSQERLSTFEPKPLSKQERALLIQLALQAKKAGFKPEPSRKAYVCKNLEKVPAFFQQVLPSWSFAKHNLPDTFRHIKVRRLQAELRALPVSEHTFSLELSLYCTLKGTKHTLSPDQRALVLHLRKKQEAIYLPDYGIVDVRLEESSFVDSFLDKSKNFDTLTLSNYNLLSLYPPLEAVLAPELLAWKKAVEAILDPSLALAQAQKPLLETLRPYQREGVAWLRNLTHLGLHPLLADDMGLGKTLQVLSFLHLFATTSQPSLVVCPASVVPVWQKEADRFFKGRILCSSLEEQAIPKASAQGHALRLYIASYGQLRRYQARLEAMSFEYAILDEAQFIKNSSSKTARAAYCIQAKHRIALSGTPIENHLQDMESIFHFLMPGLLGTRKDFQDFYLRQAEAAPALVKQQLQPFILRRLKETVAPDLPQKTDILLPCPLSPLQKHLYLACCSKTLQTLSLDLKTLVTTASLSVLTALMRLRQICCAPFLLPGHTADTEKAFEHSGKLQVLLDRLPVILESGHKVVIFSQFTSLLEPLKAKLEDIFAGICVYYLSGKTQNRASLVESFQAQDGPALFLISLKAGGTGITLHAADYVFLLDPWWNPAVEDQAINRIHRIGQTKPVFVYRLISPGTLEERIQDLKSFKHTLAEGVLSSEPILQALASAYGSLRELIEYRE